MLGSGFWTLGTPGLALVLLIWVAWTRRAVALRGSSGGRLLPVVYLFGLASPVLLSLAGSQFDGRLVLAAELARVVAAVALVAAVLVVRREVGREEPVVGSLR